MLGMRRVIGVMVLAFAASGALAGPPLKVTLAPDAKGVTAKVLLPKAVDRFAFEENADDVRQDTWHAPADMTLKDGVLKRVDGKAFSSFTIQLTPDTAPRDRRYPALTRIGEGWQVYGPYFAGKETPAPAATVVARKGWQALPRAKAGQVSLAGYAYVGPSSLVEAGAETLVVAPNVSPDLRAQIATAGQGTAAYYQRRLGVGLPAKPVLIATRVPEFTGGGWQGDTVDGPMMSLRFFGPAVAAGDDAGQVSGFVAHESFHFWNSRFLASDDAENAPWLHEGAAEYAALLATRALGTRDEGAVAKALAGRLTACAASLGDKDLAEHGPRRNKAVYDCGVLVQWTADLKLRAASNGQRDVLDAWREIFVHAETGDHRYGVKEFMVAAGMTEADEDPLRLLMRPGQADRWSRLTTALIQLGATVTPTRSADADRAALMFGLLGPLCRDNYGFFGGDGDFIKLDTGDRCGVANGDPKVDRVAGHDIVKDASAAFDTVAVLCASGGASVPLAYQGKAVVDLPCRKLPPAPKAWTVTKWR